MDNVRLATQTYNNHQGTEKRDLCKPCLSSQIKTFIGTQSSSPAKSRSHLTEKADGKIDCSPNMGNYYGTDKSDCQRAASPHKKGEDNGLKASYVRHFLYSNSNAYSCLVSPACGQIFATVQDQAHHHLTSHGLTNPYICTVCHRTMTMKAFQTEAELVEHGILVGHCDRKFDFDAFRHLQQS